VKIFDFGLAKELRDEKRNLDGTYKLTGMTGSMRYMAPEVANGEPYNASCDVYSFAVLLWEIMAMKPPYEMYTPKSLREKVYNGPHKRPVIDDSWPYPIKICLKRSWGGNLHDRNTMEQVRKILRKECVQLRKGDESGLDHYQRRSTHVFKGRSGHGSKKLETAAAAAAAAAAMTMEKVDVNKVNDDTAHTEKLSTLMEF